MTANTTSGTGGALSFTYSVEQAFYIHSITVTYTTSSGDTPAPPTCATPTFSPAAGTYTSAQNVTISTSTAGATIYYTTDGNAPTTSSSVYENAIQVSSTTTIKAIAVKDGYDNSEVAEAAYTIKQAVPGYAIDFESDLDCYTDWTFTNIGNGNTAISAHGGSKYGANINESGNAVQTASVQTKEAIAQPGTFSCYVSKTSKNTTSSNWKVQVSGDETDWTDVATQSATSMDAGTWVEFTADLSSYRDVYVRLYYEGSNAVRTVDNISLTMRDPNALPTPTVTINVPQSFNTDLAGATNVSAGTLTASVTHDDSAVADATVTWSSSNPSVATINESTGAVTLVAVGTATITATFAGNDDYAAATGTYELTVDNSMAKGGANNPYTVTEALDATAGTECYVQGIVCSVSSTSVNSNGQIHYYISADGTEDGDVMNIYNGLGLNRAAFASIDDIAVGDQVTVYGTLSTYNGANQMAANNYLVRHITKAPSNITKTGNITLSAADLSTTATATGFFTTSSTGAITYEIANTTVATVNAEGVVTPVAAGATTLTVSQAADASYKAGSIEITVTVQDATKEDPITYDTDKELAYGETFTLTYNDDYLTDGEVTMVSSNPAVASVKGLTITAAAVGTATITVTYAAGVTYNAGNSTFTLTVTAPAASETAQASSFQKVTATSDITAGQYLIVYEDGGVAFNGGLETLDDVGNTIDVTISEGTIAVSDETTAAAFTIDPEARTLTNAAGKYIGKTASGNGLDVKDEAITNTFAIDNGNAVITASGGSVLKYNSNSNQNRFRYYGSGQQAIQLYKLSSGPTVKLNASGYATYCSEYPLDFTDAKANGYSAWAVSSVDGETGEITFAQITGTIVGGTGVLLKGTAGAPVQLVSAASENQPTNQLEGTLAPTYVEANQYYGLSGNTFKKINAGTVPAGKAMLPASAVNGSSQGVKAFTFVFGGTTTGVNAVDNGQWTMDNGAIFSLSGQRLAKPQKGINIINGKKVLVK